MSTSDQPSEEELRAAYEAELKKIRIEQILLEQVVSLVNLGMRKTGLSPGTEDERDVGQVRLAIEAVRALLPLIDQVAPPQATAIRDALSQLQLAFVRLGGNPESDAAPSGAPAGGEAPPPPPGQAPGGPQEPPSRPSPPEPDAPKPDDAGPAQRSGRLWVPGQ
ncbi:MAG TPA: hypothetical protein VG325_01205 [Solirubrobacteraceae bacterium]|jgi:hypothetical protein|nr:hypothetical protein [Solirubrobacteraceae bacterium]